MISQVIPAEVDHIDFTWQAKKGSAVPYKITFMHAPSKAMDNPSVNISTEGIVPTHTDKFRLLFPCTGKLAEQVETLFQVSGTKLINSYHHSTSHKQNISVQILLLMLTFSS